jgi:N-acylneuraminate cytidylyltransferase/CMP-N,N'-diacetyllegionaminic acid synthase
MNKSVLAIIPARGGSKGVKRKNLRDLGGKPLITWSIEEAKKSKYIDKLIVSTEDDDIAEVSKKYGADVIRRPSELATDTATTQDVIINCLEQLKKSFDYVPKFILLLQCTCPFRKVKHIDEAIVKFLDSIETADSLISITEQDTPPWWFRDIDKDGYIKNFLEYDKNKFARRQDFPKVYKLNGAIYIIKIEKFLELKSFETEKTISYIMDEYSSVDIDNEIDYLFANFLKTDTYK